MIDCCSCGVSFEPKKANQKHCSAPCLARFCRNCNYKTVAGKAESDDDSKLGSVEQRKAQMDELFRGYEDVHPLVINKLKDGSRVVLLSDMQIPFEERWMIGATTGKNGAVEKFLAYYQPDIIIYVGDILDCYTISSFNQSPNRKWTLKSEAESAMKMLDVHRALVPQARMIFIDGNHEERIWRTLIKITQIDTRARELIEVLNITSLTSKHILRLDERNIEWLPYGGYIDLLGFIITHGDYVSQYSSYSARKMSDRYRSSGASGHTHRLGAYHFTTHGVSHVWYELGSLCRGDPEYAHNANWQLGFAAGEVKNNQLHIGLINAFNKTFYASGKFF